MKLKLLAMMALSLLTTSASHAWNLHIVDENEETGFAVYRTGAPNLKDFKKLCALGITEMFVLSGTAAKHEYKYQSYCPGLKVVYNERQNDDIPLSADFLKKFDDWIMQAKAQGKKVAFRCECGCHRTGRLAAYYQMRFQNLTLTDSLQLMHDHGHFMLFRRYLIPQVQALSLYIKNKPCTLGTNVCVIPQETSDSILAENAPEKDTD